MIQRQLTLIMENKPGALARVVGLFHQRGYNIDSLHVDPISDLKPYEFIEEDYTFKKHSFYFRKKKQGPLSYQLTIEQDVTS